MGGETIYNNINPSVYSATRGTSSVAPHGAAPSRNFVPTGQSEAQGADGGDQLKRYTANQGHPKRSAADTDQFLIGYAEEAVSDTSLVRR